MIKPYYQDEWVAQYCDDALIALREIKSDSVDLLCTDPPYGISFMGKDWDKALPDIKVWKECYRVLKDGSFAFVMSIPRADCLSRMIISLEDAGFMVNFTPIFWAYASGFPKAQNIGKAVDKRLGADREVVGRSNRAIAKNPKATDYQGTQTFAETAEGREASKYLTAPSTPQAKVLDGSYGGFQPKPAVEVIIVAMKPLSEKTFVDQALKNGKGITWLDSCRIPYDKNDDALEKGLARAETPRADITGGKLIGHGGRTKIGQSGMSESGRFPANLLVSDDVLNDGEETFSHRNKEGIQNEGGCFGGGGFRNISPADSGSFSRYFDLDKWAQFLIVPKASKSEKNKGLGEYHDYQYRECGYSSNISGSKLPRANSHPTVKPLKLMSYLITLGSREGDTIFDPYSGSGTTLLASKLLNRKSIGVDNTEAYCEIAAKRCSQGVFNLGM